MTRAIMCTVSTRDQAQAIVRSLSASGFVDEDVSVLFPDRKGTRDFAHEHGTKAPEGGVAGAAAGGAVGGTVGLLAGLGLLAIPGLGPFLAAGPILAALSGAAVGAGGGGLVGALVGLGIPEVQAKVYEGKVKGGSILICAHCKDHAKQERAETIFKEAGADDVAGVIETPVPSAARL